MRRDDWIVAFAIGVVFVSVAIALYVSWFVFPALRLRPTAILVSAAVLGGLFLVRPRVGICQASANEALRYLAHQFRLRGHRVADKPGHIAVHIGRLSALRVRAEPVAYEPSITYQVDATRSGWAYLVLLVLFDWTALVATVAGVYLFLHVRSFAVRVLHPIVPVGTGLLPRPPEDVVRATLIDALAEAHRLAADAYEAERSTFWNFELVILTSALLLWAFILVTLGITSSFPAFLGVDAFLAAALVSALAAGGVSAVIRGRSRGRLEGSRTWSDRLSAALTREIQRATSEGAEPSSFEILAQATAHMPAWLGARRKAGIFNDPGPGILFATALALLITAIFGTVFFVLIGHVVLALLVGSAAVGLSAGAEFGRRLWKRHQEGLYALTAQQWERRIASLHDHMERFLRDL